MKLLNILNLTTDYFTEKGIDNPRLNAELLLCHLLGVNRIDLYLNYERPMSPAEMDRFREMVRWRGQRYPLHYLTGQVEFMSLPFVVSPGVFIPRPETEILVEAVIDRLRNGQKLRVADLGTGAGVIAVSLAFHLPGANVWATDISPDALRTAKINAEGNGVLERITFLRGNLFEPLQGVKLQGCLDALISNPPYIGTEEFDALPEEVRLYEPTAALDGGRDGLAFHRLLIEGAVKYLKNGGLLAVEVGEGQAEQVVALMEHNKNLGRITVTKDLSQIDRVVAGCKEG